MAFDPRAEPDDEKTAEPCAGGGVGAQDHISLPTGRPPMNALTSGKWEHEDAEEPSSKKPAVVVVDPRLEELEPLIGRGDWSAVAAKLGPFDAAGALPPQLGLMYAVAINEVGSSDEARAAGATGGTSDLAIRCVAAMCGVPQTSFFALVIAKRLLRKNPSAFRGREAPRPRTSLLIVLVTLVAGGGLGWFLSSQAFRGLHLF